MTAPSPFPSPQPHGQQRIRPIPSWPGWLCLAPAVVLLIGQVVVPSMRTFLMSFTEGGPEPVREWVGLDNYLQIQDPMQGLVGGLLPGVVVMIAALLFALLVGFLGGRSGGAPAVAVRVLLGLLVVCYAPVAMVFGLIALVGIPDSASFSPVLLAAYLPITAAAAAVVALAIFNSADRQVFGTALAMAIAGGLGALAWSLQTSEIAMMLGARPSESLALQSWRVGFTQFQFGRASAINAILLLLIGLLGVVATVAVLRAGVRFEFAAETRRTTAGTGVIALVIVAVGVLTVLAVHHRWILGLFRLNPAQAEWLGWSGIATAILNSWVPTGIATLLQVAVALLAGAGIGFFRPIGAGSRWLVLIFAPCMFTGVALLTPVYFQDLSQLDMVSMWITLIPRLWVVGPAIVVFSWLFAAVRRHREQTGSTAAVLPAAGGIIGLTTVILWLVQAQGLTWNWLVAAQAEHRNASVALLQMVAMAMDTDRTPLWLPLPLPVLAVLAAAAVLSLLVIRNVRIGSGPA